MASKARNHRSEAKVRTLVLATRVSFLSLLRFRGQLEGVPQAALHALAGVDGGLDRHLIRGAVLEEAAGAHVQAFGVLPDHHEVDLARGPCPSRGSPRPGRASPGRRLMYWSSSKRARKQDALFQDARGHVRVADGAQVDGVELAQFGNHRIRQDFAGALVALAAQVVMVKSYLMPAGTGHGVQDLEALRPPLPGRCRPRG